MNPTSAQRLQKSGTFDPGGNTGQAAQEAIVPVEEPTGVSMDLDQRSSNLSSEEPPVS
ncbi:MAG: hypothetical protein HY660_09010 [Armatimonadetes bacterium]|nr:hypothetical protein [Armatimonadota bacterium]